MVVVLVLAVGLLGIAVEMLASHLTHALSGYQVVWTRYGVHLLFMWLVIRPRVGSTMVRTARPLRQIAHGACMIGMPVCYLVTLGRVSATESALWFWTTPFALLVLALGSREGRGLKPWLAAAIGFAGVVLIGHPPFHLHRALLGPIGTGAFFALYLRLTRDMHDEPLMTTLFYTAATVFVPFTLLMPFVWHWPALHDWAVLTGIGLSGWLWLFFLDKLTAAAPLATIAPVLYLEVLLTPLLSALTSGALPGRSALLGSGVIVAGALVALVRRR